MTGAQVRVARVLSLGTFSAAAAVCVADVLDMIAALPRFGNPGFITSWLIHGYVILLSALLLVASAIKSDSLFRAFGFLRCVPARVPNHLLPELHPRLLSPFTTAGTPALCHRLCFSDALGTGLLLGFVGSLVIDMQPIGLYAGVAALVWGAVCTITHCMTAGQPTAPRMEPLLMPP